MNQIHKYPPKLKPKDYDILVQTLLMANPELVDAPAGASKLDQLSQHLKIIAQVELQRVQQKKTWNLVMFGIKVVIIILFLVNFITSFYIDING